MSEVSVPNATSLCLLLRVKRAQSQRGTNLWNGPLRHKKKVATAICRDLSGLLRTPPRCPQIDRAPGTAFLSAQDYSVAAAASAGAAALSVAGASGAGAASSVAGISSAGASSVCSPPQATRPTAAKPSSINLIDFISLLLDTKTVEKYCMHKARGATISQQ